MSEHLSMKEISKYVDLRSPILKYLIEIEKKFWTSNTNQKYKFPGRKQGKRGLGGEDSSDENDTSLVSLKNVTKYKLYSQKNAGIEKSKRELSRLTESSQKLNKIVGLKQFAGASHLNFNGRDANPSFKSQPRPAKDSRLKTLNYKEIANKRSPKFQLLNEDLSNISRPQYDREQSSSRVKVNLLSKGNSSQRDLKTANRSSGGWNTGHDNLKYKILGSKKEKNDSSQANKHFGDAKYALSSYRLKKEQPTSKINLLLGTNRQPSRGQKDKTTDLNNSKKNIPYSQLLSGQQSPSSVLNGTRSNFFDTYMKSSRPTENSYHESKKASKYRPSNQSNLKTNYSLAGSKIRLSPRNQPLSINSPTSPKKDLEASTSRYAEHSKAFNLDNNELLRLKQKISDRAAKEGSSYLKASSSTLTSKKLFSSIKSRLQTLN